MLRWVVAIALVTLCFQTRAIDLAAIGQVGDRQQAAAEVETARQAVATARAKTGAARQRLDDFLAKHFEPAAQVPAQLPPSEPSDASSDNQPAQNSEADSLRAQIQDLKAERDRLLVTLTEAHPEVVDVDDRIADAESKLHAKLGAGPRELPAPSPEPARNLAADGLQRSQADAAQYRLLFADWQACEHDLERARDAETKAVERLAALPVAAPPVESPAEESPADGTLAKPDAQPPAASVVIDDPVEQAPAAAPTTAVAAPAASNASSHSLALAALAVALAISALAAVKLSRSGSDPFFASADDVAAALAVPVVGIVPAAIPGKRVGDAAAMRRMVVVGLQVLVAVSVFLAIAYVVQHIDDLTRFCASPITSLRKVLGI